MKILLVLLFALTLTTICASQVEAYFGSVWTDPHTVYIAVSSEKVSKIYFTCKWTFQSEVIAAVFEEQNGYGGYLYVTIKGPNGAPYIAKFFVAFDPSSCYMYPKKDGKTIPTPVQEKDIVYFDPVPRSQYTNFHSFATTDASNMSTSETTALADFALFGPGTASGAVANDFFRYSVNEDGTSAGQKKPFFTNPAGTFILGGSISHDGKMAVQFTAKSATSWQISSRLIDNSNPAKPASSWSIAPYNGYSLDISGGVTLAAGAGGISQTVRYLVYRAFRNVGAANQESQLLVQTIDDATGKPIGAPRELTPFVKAFNGNLEAAQSIAIAPDASSVIFASYSDGCKRYIIKGFDLSPTGTRVGSIKTVVPCGKLKESGARGLDITGAPD